MGAGRATCVIPANTTLNYRGVGPLLRGPPPGTKSGDASRPSGGGGAGFGQGPGFGGQRPEDETLGYTRAVAPFWQIPEGVRVLPDGAWRVGGFPIIHTPSLRHLKTRLVFDEGGAFIADGSQRMPVTVDGPPFEVLSLVLEGTKGEVHAPLAARTEQPPTPPPPPIPHATRRP